MKVLATEHVQLMPEIYNQATVKHIYNMTPKNIKDDLCKIVFIGTLEQIFDNILKILKEHRMDILSRITMEEKPSKIGSLPKKPFENFFIKMESTIVRRIFNVRGSGESLDVRSFTKSRKLRRDFL